MSATNAALQPRRRGRPRAAIGVAGETRSDLLLRAAVAQFAQHGFDGAGLRQIAAEANVDPALVVHHFGSKLQLWQAAIDHLSAQLVTALGGFSEPARSDERLDHVIAQLVDMLCDRPDLAAFILREVVQQNDRSEYSYDRLVQPIYALVHPHILAFLAPGSHDADADFLFFALAGAIVSSIAARPFLGRLSAAARDDGQFRATLKQTMSAQLSARAGRFTGPSS